MDSLDDSQTKRKYRLLRSINPGPHPLVRPMLTHQRHKTRLPVSIYPMAPAVFRFLAIFSCLQPARALSIQSGALHRCAWAAWPRSLLAYPIGHRGCSGADRPLLTLCSPGARPFEIFREIYLSGPSTLMERLTIHAVRIRGPQQRRRSQRQ